jgi:hypothetical protein
VTIAVVPWCSSCDRFLSPPTVNPDGTCPDCGRLVDPGHAHVAGEAKEELPPVPWHLKLLAGALAVYLGFRFFQMLEWLWHRL